MIINAQTGRGYRVVLGASDKRLIFRRNDAIVSEHSEMFLSVLVVAILFDGLKFSYCACNEDAFSNSIFRGCYRARRYCETFRITGCVRNMTKHFLHLLSPLTTVKEGSFVDNYQLWYLHMSNNNITTVEPKAFRHNGQFHEINFENNYISEIYKGVFTGLEVLVINLSYNELVRVGRVFGKINFQTKTDLKLYLDHNKISSIHRNAFVDSAIYLISLSHNKLKSVKAGTFSNLSKLRYLDLSCNLIHTVEKRAIDGGLNRYLKKLNLAMNELTNVDFFTGMRINNLFLSLNNISSISAAAMERVNVTALYIGVNPWICECLQEFLAEKGELVRVKSVKQDLNVHWSEEIPVCIESLHGKCEKEAGKRYSDMYHATVNKSKLFKDWPSCNLRLFCHGNI